ncbi:hypothetical protein ACWER6_09630 [Streptomyces sp. NPDC004009]
MTTNTGAVPGDEVRRTQGDAVRRQRAEGRRAVPRPAPAPGEPVRCVIPDVTDRVWTPSTLSRLVAAAGRSVTGGEPARLNPGAAGGARLVMLVLAPAGSASA